MNKENELTESVEQAAQEIFDRGSYKNDSSLQSAYLIGARFGANFQLQKDSKEIERLRNALEKITNCLQYGLSYSDVQTLAKEALKDKPE